MASSQMDSLIDDYKLLKQIATHSPTGPIKYM